MEPLDPSRWPDIEWRLVAVDEPGNRMGPNLLVFNSGRRAVCTPSHSGTEGADLNGSLAKQSTKGTTSLDLIVIAEPRD